MSDKYFCCLIFTIPCCSGKSRYFTSVFKSLEFFNFIVFIYGCAGSSLLYAVCFLQLQQAGATLCCSARACHCGGFHCRAWVLGYSGFSSCGPRAQLLCSMWDLLGLGVEPVSPSLAGRLPNTGPPKQSLVFHIKQNKMASLLHPTTDNKKHFKHIKYIGLPIAFPLNVFIPKYTKSELKFSFMTCSF